MHQQPDKSKSRAYTLIEILIVVAILGISAAMLIPYIGDRGGLEVQAAVRMVISDLSFAQSDALAHQEYRRVYFYPDSRGYCIIRVTDADFNNAFDPATADYITDPLGSGDQAYIVDFTTDDRFAGVAIKTVNIDSGSQFVTFDALGGTVRTGSIPGVGGTIEVSSGSTVYQIDLAPFTGKLTVANVTP